MVRNQLHWVTHAFLRRIRVKRRERGGESTIEKRPFSLESTFVPELRQTVSFAEILPLSAPPLPTPDMQQ